MSFNRKCDNKAFTQIITLDLEDADFNPLNTPFTAELKVLKTKGCVAVKIPSLTFTVSVPGFVYTSANNLPMKVWPVSPIPPSEPLQVINSNINLVAYIFADGTLRIKGVNNLTIPVGTYTTKSITISYSILKCYKPPENFKISIQSSNIIGTIPDQLGTDYGDKVSGDFVGDKVVYCWNETQSNLPVAEQQTQVVVRTGKIVCGNKLCLNEPVIAFSATPGIKSTFWAEVVIDPYNHNHLVLAVNVVDGSGQAYIFIVISDDFGKTWQTNPGPVSGPPPQDGIYREEQVILYDKFDNLYLALFLFGVDETLTIFNPSEWQLWSSINGGSSWNLLFVINAANTMILTDAPYIAFGPDSQGGYALWYAWTNLQEVIVSPSVPSISAGYISVLGKGLFGGHIEYQLTNIPPNTGSNVQLAVGNNGQVFLALQQYRNNGEVDLLSPGFDSSLFLSINPNGTVGYNASSFQPVQTIFKGNLGQDQYTNSSPVSWQPIRGIFAQASNFFAYDKKKGRLYAVGVDKRPNFNEADYVSIFYIYTDNNGKSWSKMHQINNVNIGSRGIASVAINKKTGYLSVSFYDTRNYTPENVTTDFYAAIFKPE